MLAIWYKQDTAQPYPVLHTQIGSDLPRTVNTNLTEECLSDAGCMDFFFWKAWRSETATDLYSLNRQKTQTTPGTSFFQGVVSQPNLQQASMNRPLSMDRLKGALPKGQEDQSNELVARCGKALLSQLSDTSLTARPHSWQVAAKQAP